MNKKRQVFRIGIDARFLGPRQKGLGRYVQKLVEELEKNFQFSIFNFQFIIFLRQENWDEYQPQNPNFKKVLADYKWYGWKEQIFLPWKIWQEKIDLMHFAHFNLPIFCGCPFVVTIHDLVLKKFSTRRASTLGPLCYWLKNLAYRIVIWLAIKRAKKIIAVSHYTKEDILRYFKVEPGKIRVIYEGQGQPSNSSPREGCYLRAALDNIKPYLLYVGNAYPHKNLERLILAFQKLIEDYQMDLKLVLVGEIDYFYKKIQNKILSYKLPRKEIKDFSRGRQVTPKRNQRFLTGQASYKNIILTDFVSDEQLETLYQNASLYVFPSLCEGFGLPPLEAMAHGLPVVCSQATCLPEILGPAALYFDPENINDIAEKIKSVLENKSLQQELIKKGFKQIKKYSWSKMAKETLETYQTVI